jgi:hypothetical protein
MQPMVDPDVEKLQYFNDSVNNLSPQRRNKGTYWIQYERDQLQAVEPEKTPSKPSLQAVTKEITTLFGNVQRKWEENKLTELEKQQVIAAARHYKKVAEHVASQRFWTWKRILVCIGSCLTLIGAIPFMAYYDSEKAKELGKLGIDQVQELETKKMDDWLRRQVKMRGEQPFVDDLKPFGYTFESTKFREKYRIKAQALFWFVEQIREKKKELKMTYDEIAANPNAFSPEESQAIYTLLSGLPGIKENELDTLFGDDFLKKEIPLYCSGEQNIQPEALARYLQNISTIWRHIVEEQPIKFIPE